MQKIMILGGYGKAGKAIASTLAKNFNYKIIIAGRSKNKAERFVADLKKDSPQVIVEAEKVNVYNKEELITKIKDIHMIIVAIPLQIQSTLYLIDAVLASHQAHYIDLSPDQEKHKAFDQRKSFIKQGKHVFLLDAGFCSRSSGYADKMAYYESQ